jgi:hypothetical protein
MKVATEQLRNEKIHAVMENGLIVVEKNGRFFCGVGVLNKPLALADSSVEAITRAAFVVDPITCDFFESERLHQWQYTGGIQAAVDGWDQVA